jgi:hypothetical protein
MTEPGEPTPREKAEIEDVYRQWCLDQQMDPEDQQVAREYEEWWAEEHPPGEEFRW